jgi:transcriptional regulator with XRE-family HTH domain
MARRGMERRGSAWHCDSILELLTMTRTLEQIRLEAGLEAYQLAERAGVASSTVSHLERGKIKALSALTLEKIGLALKAKFAERGETFTLREYIEAVLMRRGKR